MLARAACALPNRTRITAFSVNVTDRCAACARYRTNEWNEWVSSVCRWPGRRARRQLRQRVLVGRRLRRRLGRSVQNAAIEQLLGRRDRFVEQPIAGDLGHHEVVLRDADFIGVAEANTVQGAAAATRDEITDARCGAMRSYRCS